MKAANTIPSLSAEQRRKLAAVYRFLISLSSKRKVKVADSGEGGDHGGRPTADVPDCRNKVHRAQIP